MNHKTPAYQKIDLWYVLHTFKMVKIITRYLLKHDTIRRIGLSCRYLFKTSKVSCTSVVFITFEFGDIKLPILSMIKHPLDMIILNLCISNFLRVIYKSNTHLRKKYFKSIRYFHFLFKKLISEDNKRLDLTHYVFCIFKISTQNNLYTTCGHFFHEMI